MAYELQVNEKRVCLFELHRRQVRLLSSESHTLWIDSIVHPLPSQDQELQAEIHFGIQVNGPLRYMNHKKPANIYLRTFIAPEAVQCITEAGLIRVKNITALEKSIAVAAIAREKMEEHTELYLDYNPESDTDPSFDEHSQWQQLQLTDLEKQPLQEAANLLAPDNKGLRKGQDWLIALQAPEQGNPIQSRYTTDNHRSEQPPRQREWPCNIQ